MQKFRSNAGPLNSGLEKSAFNEFNLELSQLFKTVRNLKIGQKMANEQPYIFCQMLLNYIASLIKSMALEVGR